MPRSTGTLTIDGAQQLRCMVVALTPDLEQECRRALMPIEVVRASDVRAACATMSIVLPLVVVVDENLAEADRSALVELTTACGAELVALGPTAASANDVAGRLLDALRAAERRRIVARA